MSYSIKVRVIQTKPHDWYNIVEKTVWQYAHGGTWTKCNDEHTLAMNGSGTSGMLRFCNPGGDYFLVALGVHNYKRWCDIVPDQKSGNTGVEIHPSYYADGAGNRSSMLWKQLPHLEVKTCKGVTIKVDYLQPEGNNLQATITIFN